MEWEYTANKKEIKFDKNSDFYWKSQDNSYIEEDDRPHESRNEHLIKLLGEIGRILDIGSRTGIAERVAERYGAKYYVGIDISPRNVELAQKLGRNVKIGDAHDLKEYFKFDTVISVHSLEHCHSPQKVINEVWNVLVPGGKFGLRAPMQKDLTVQRNKPGPYGELPPHFCVLNRDSLIKWMTESGFSLEYIESTDKEIIMIGEKI